VLLVLSAAVLEKFGGDSLAEVQDNMERYLERITRVSGARGDEGERAGDTGEALVGSAGEAGAGDTGEARRGDTGATRAGADADLGPVFHESGAAGSGGDD
jgi:hypothetical protein